MRYLDLMVNPETQSRFRTRSQIIQTIRQTLLEEGFLEVETPMMHTLAGGAAAKPFLTHHNALDMPLFMRIAPELFLKRLVVGGLDRVFEINRNFRNEGISTRHNPEFTMLEFYQAYATYETLMTFTEKMLSKVTFTATGKYEIIYQGHCINMQGPYEKLTMIQAIAKYSRHNEDQLASLSNLHHVASHEHINLDPSWDYGQCLLALFESLGRAQTDSADLYHKLPSLNFTFSPQPR